MTQGYFKTIEEEVRKEMAKRAAEGWEHVGEGGGNLWELHRGCRSHHVITDVEIALGGKTLWIKTERAPNPFAGEGRPETKTRECRNCAHFRNADGSVGYCHRSPPVLDERTGGGKWPLLSAGESCGEFQELTRQ